MSRVTIDIAPPEPGDIFTPAAIGNMLGQRTTFDGRPAQVVGAEASPTAEGYARVTLEVDDPSTPAARRAWNQRPLIQHSVSALLAATVPPAHAKPVYGGGMGFKTTTTTEGDVTSATTTHDESTDIVYSQVSVVRPTDWFERNATQVKIEKSLLIEMVEEGEFAFINMVDADGRALAAALTAHYARIDGA